MSQSFHRSQTPQSQHTQFGSRLNRNLNSNYPYLPGTLTGQGDAPSGSSSGTSARPVNPFVTNPHGHPSFVPVKVGGKGSGDSKVSKQPKPPDKPLMPYMRYSRKVSRLVWDSVKASNPDLKLWEIGKIIGQMWRDLTDEEKQEYIDEYETDKAQYTDAMKVYHSSPAYLSWIASKSKVDADQEVEETEKTAARRTKGGREATEQRVVSALQANEEEDDLEDMMSAKNVSAARYHRNHCLINEICNDVVIPDVRTVINESRMGVLKRQVLSLTMHQKKLEGELQQIEEKHKAKKCKFSESSEQFYDDLGKMCETRPQITEEQFLQMIAKAKEEMREKQKIVEEQMRAAKIEKKLNNQKIDDKAKNIDESPIKDENIIVSNAEAKEDSIINSEADQNNVTDDKTTNLEIDSKSISNNSESNLPNENDKADINYVSEEKDGDYNDDTEDENDETIMETDEESPVKKIKF